MKSNVFSRINGIRYHLYKLSLSNPVRLCTWQRSMPRKTLFFTCGYIGFRYLKGSVCGCCEVQGEVSSSRIPSCTIDTEKPQRSLSQSIVLVLRLSYIFVLFSPAVLLHIFSFVFDFASLRKAKLLYMRFALQMSGPAFVKLGQWISTRRDIFLPDVCRTLGDLQTNCYTHPWEHTVQVLESELGHCWSDDFEDIDRIPVGSGCVAQVYKWSLSPKGLQKVTCTGDNSQVNSK